MTTEEAAEAFARKISSRFDVVCFDLDQCAVQTHSRGRLRRRDLDAFASHVSKDLVAAVPALLRHNCSLAIVTHSDLAQHGTLKPRDTFILGDDLVHEVLKRCPGLKQYAHAFFVVAWRPKSRGDEGKKDLGKIRHMRTCAAFYDVPIERCVLFDDDASNCSLVIFLRIVVTQKKAFACQIISTWKKRMITLHHQQVQTRTITLSKSQTAPLTGLIDGTTNGTMNTSPSHDFICHKSTRIWRNGMDRNLRQLLMCRYCYPCAARQLT